MMLPFGDQKITWLPSPTSRGCNPQCLDPVGFADRFRPRESHGECLRMLRPAFWPVFPGMKTPRTERIGRTQNVKHIPGYFTKERS